MPKRKLKTEEEVGVVTNAPATTNSKGYGFVTLEDGGVVYVPKSVVRASGMSYDHVGEQARVRYQTLRDGRMIAVRVNLVLDAGTADEDIMNELVAIDDAMDDISDRIDRVYAILEERGCKVPETAVE